MSSADTARCTYEASRNEILERIRLRDNAQLAYLGAVGATFSIATSGHDSVLLVLPYLALAATLLVCQHDWTIATLCTFIAEELRAYLDGLREAAPSWEFSRTLSQYSIAAVRLRTTAHLVLIAAPAVFGQFWVKRTHATPGILFTSAWWLGWLALLGAAIVIGATYSQRIKNYKVTRWLNQT